VIGWQIDQICGYVSRVASSAVHELLHNRYIDTLFGNRGSRGDAYGFECIILLSYVS
jgi:hypothetical protein